MGNWRSGLYQMVIHF